MTRTLELTIERVRALSEQRQDEIARIVSKILDDEELAGKWLLSAEQIAEIEAELAADGPYATDAEMEEFFARYRA